MNSLRRRRAAGRGAGLLVALLVFATGARGGPAGYEDLLRKQAQADAAVAAAIRYIAAQVRPEGLCRGEFPANNPRFGGKTALCAYALLAAGVPPTDPAVARALQWLGKAKLQGTYPVAMRACAYAALQDPNVRPLLEKDVQWLIAAASPEGGHTYGPFAPDAAAPDNSNSQMAVLALWGASRYGLAAPREFWRKTERYWTDQQQLSGGWGYTSRTTPARENAYGSMTAAGLATLYACFDSLRGDQYVRTNASADVKAMTDAFDWIAKNFTVTENPGKGLEWYYYWLYSVQRVGQASGFKYFGTHNWFAEGLDELLATQNADGSWGAGDLADTAFALLFLVRGRDPILLNKLQFDGRWNARPRDAANLARWLGFTFERPVAWQVVGASAALEDFQDAPILYISGAGPIELTDEQVQKLRTFVLQGGTILSEAAGNNGDFTMDIQRLYRRLFPEWPLQQLDARHPLYTLQFSPRDMTGLMGVSNGVRLLAIHSPRELSLGLQLGPADKANLPAFEMAANLYLYVTEKGPLRPRGVPALEPARSFTPRAALRVARLRYKGNWDPEPQAWRNFATHLGNRYRIKIETPEVPLENLDAARWPIAALTGTDKVDFSDAQRAALKKYFAAGGTLVADAAGGSREFAAAFEEQILPLVDKAIAGRLASHMLQDGPAATEQVNYRHAFAISLGTARHEMRLRAVQSGERLAIVYSREDLTGGLAGCPAWGVPGYTRDSANALMTNILCLLSGIPKK